LKKKEDKINKEIIVVNDDNENKIKKINEDYTIELLDEEENMLKNEDDKNIITVLDEKKKKKKPNYPLYYNNKNNTGIALSNYIYNI
jgi:hypothetical protein